MSTKKRGVERRSKKAIREGKAEADYAGYALRHFHILPNVFVNLPLAERMFIEGVIEMELQERR